MIVSITQFIRTRLMLVGCASLCATSTLMAQPAPIPSIERWVNESSVIVKGAILEVGQASTDKVADTRSAEATVQVNDLFKGTVKGEAIVVEYKSYVDRRRENTIEPNDYSFKRGQCDLLFLRQGPNGKYVFADSYESAVSVTCRKTSLTQAAHTVRTKVEMELVASLFDSDAIIARSSLGYIKRLGVQQFIGPLHEFALLPDSEVKATAYAALIKLGDYSLLEEAIAFSSAPTSDSNLRLWKNRIIDAIGEIGIDRTRRVLEAGGGKRAAYCSSRAGLPFDQSVVSRLESTLTSSNLDLRRAAARALRGICDPSSASALVLALNDSDPQVQYDAMMSLAALEDFPGTLPAPSESIFDRHPETYVDRWRGWWKDTGHTKYARVE